MLSEDILEQERLEERDARGDGAPREACDEGAAREGGAQGTEEPSKKRPRRMACLDVPALPLQILRRDRPEWAGLPLAVVAEDKPQAAVLWVSRAARDRGVRPGMRYAAALALTRELRAAPVAQARIAEVRAELVGALHRYSPRVAPDEERAGAIFIDPEGMLSLFGSYTRWAEAVHGELDALDLFGSVVVGFSRMPCWAIARTRRGAVVLRDEEEERTLAARVHVTRLDLPHTLEEALAVLDVRTLGDFLALPIGELRTRFGPDAARAHARFSSALQEPLTVVSIPDPIVLEAELDPPDDDSARLLFCAKGALHASSAALASRRLALAALRITLVLERGEPHVEVLRPARATRDAVSVLELLRLRLASVVLSSRVERLRLEIEAAPLESGQLPLLPGARGRRVDPGAASRGLARLRAAFGEDAVTCAKLEDAWMPEASFRWEPTREVATPRVSMSEGPELALVRRFFSSPRPLQMGPGGMPKTTPAIAAMCGPYRVESGWPGAGWGSGTASRDYWYAERADGALLWLYRDPALDRWFVQGVVD